MYKHKQNTLAAGTLIPNRKSVFHMNKGRRRTMERTYPTRRRKRRRHIFRRLFLLLFTAALIMTVYQHASTLRNAGLYEHLWNAPAADTQFQKTLAAFAETNHLTRSDWPQELMEAGEKNPELEDFVLQYPLKKDAHPEIDLNEYKNTDSVPLLLQWDERWGYSEYSGGLFGLTGCGPTCLSMVSIYLLDDPSYNPQYMAEFSQNNGYSVPGNGSAWTLISEGGQKLGLDVTEIPLDKDRIIRNLEVGNPIICVMGPGDFTTTGHFIVLTGYVDGKIQVNDPNSPHRSSLLWDYDAIQDQIRNLWVCR